MYGIDPVLIRWFLFVLVIILFVITVFYCLVASSGFFGSGATSTFHKVKYAV